MKLDKENMRKMRQLILFTIIILIALWNYKMIFDAIRFVFGIIFPFLLGGGIAFVLNVPMSFFEEKLFYNRYLKDKKIANRIARPISLVLTIAVLIGVVVLVMFVVIPELTKTVISLGKTIQTFIPEAQRFLEELFTDNSEVRAWLDGLNLDLDQLVDQAGLLFPERGRQYPQFDDVRDRFHCERCYDICHCVCLCVLCTSTEGKAESAGTEGAVRISPLRTKWRAFSRCAP